jgi:lipoprotein-anchoring transpeptidase ErfK/SrfK
VNWPRALLLLVLLTGPGFFLLLRRTTQPAGLAGPAQVVAAGPVAEPDGAPPVRLPSADPAPEPAAKAADPEPEDAGRRILVSIRDRRLWLVEGGDTLMSAPVAVGMARDFTYNGREYHFGTPRGRRRVLAKAPDPVWVVPEWHYFEKAADMGLSEVVKLQPDDRILLSDSSVLEVRGDQVGRVNQFGNFAAFTPGTEIIFDDRMYIPPLNTAQRRVPDALGPYKLDTGDGYLIHGTHPYNEETIGEAVSHGCVRMNNEDLARLYPLVPRGTPVVVY